jgi:hypothetical protein
LPEQILRAAGLPLVSTSSRTVNLTYTATNSTATAGASRLTRSAIGVAGPNTGTQLGAQVSLTFGPADSTTRAVLAPVVPLVAQGSTISVAYDLSRARGVTNPVLEVSHAGRTNPITGTTGADFHPAYIVPISALKGTVTVPVSALDGGGIYGIGIKFGSLPTQNPAIRVPLYSDFAFTRVQPTTQSTRPAAPLLSVSGVTPGHSLEIPYNGSFNVQYDVSRVVGATGVILEFSAAGPTAWNIYNPFSNPNGTQRDHNGIDTSSLAYMPLGGTSGIVTLKGVEVHLIPTLYHDVRVIPTAGGTPIGEASEVSSLKMDGVNPNDGGSLYLGYGIDQNGANAILNSDAQTIDGVPLGEAELFDQSTNMVTGGLLGSPGGQLTTGSTWQTYGWGIWGTDVALEEFHNPGFPGGGANVLINPQTGYPTGFWQPQIPTTFNVLDAGVNSVSTAAAFYGFDSSNNTFSVFGSDIAAGTTGPLYDITAPVTGANGVGFYDGIGQDTAHNTVALGGDTSTQDAVFVRVDLGTGNVTFFKPSQTEGCFMVGFGYDPVSNYAAAVNDTAQQIMIYNMATQTGTSVVLPGNLNQLGIDPGSFHGLWIAADSTNHHFLTAQPVAPDALRDDNALSRVLTYDESGNLLKAQERFWLFNFPWPTAQNGIQVNPTMHRAYIYGPLSQQLEPFNY